ncbi:MAG: hypothetical protein ABIJ48_00545 [Actinomycetota bacterium]
MKREEPDYQPGGAVPPEGHFRMQGRFRLRLEGPARLERIKGDVDQQREMLVRRHRRAHSDEAGIPGAEASAP